MVGCTLFHFCRTADKTGALTDKLLDARRENAWILSSQVAEPPCMTSFSNDGSIVTRLLSFHKLQPTKSGTF